MALRCSTAGVICEFLDTLSTDGVPMFPKHALRFRALRFQALGDGISDAAVLARGQMQLPPGEPRDNALARQKAKVSRSLDMLEGDRPATHVDIGTIAVACALGYLDLRFPEDRWREGRPQLAAWFETVSKQPCLVRTVPPG